MNPGSVLEVQGVTVRFGGLTALDSVSLAVPPRHVLGVIGPNGAGKTTLLNVLCGFIRPDAGEVLFGGRRCTTSGRTGWLASAWPGPCRGSACTAG